MSGQHTFIRVILITTLLLISLIGLFNFIIDPYAIFRSFDIQGINTFKPAVYVNNSRAKQQAVSLIRPRSLVLGTSRAEIGIDPDSPYWSGSKKPSYNLSLMSGRMTDIQNYFEFANSIRPVSHVLLGVDYMMFRTKTIKTERNRSRLPRAVHADPKINHNSDFFRSLFSLDAIKASLHTILEQDRAVFTKYKYNGVRSSSKLEQRKKTVGHRIMFLGSEKKFLYQGLYSSARKMKSDPDYQTSLSAFRDLLLKCADENIDIRVFISPAHARQLELMHLENAWLDFERWKRDLVQIMEQVKQTGVAGQAPVLWDFSGYNTITTETVPQAGDKLSSMKWYWESSHYTQSTGDLILQRIFSYPEATHLPADFGVRIGPDNIEKNLSAIRTQRSGYLSRYADDISDLRKISKIKAARSAIK